MLSCTNPVKESAVFIQSTLMVQEPLMSYVTKQQSVRGGGGEGTVNFYRGWADYKNGFGNLDGEFWLGLDKIHRSTKTKNRLRVDLEDTTSKTAYAEYDMFAVTSERTRYQMSLGSFSGKFACVIRVICVPNYVIECSCFVFRSCL